MNYRIFVEKKPPFRVRAHNLRDELNRSLSLNIQTLRLFAVYDLFGFGADLCQRSLYSVFGERAIDDVTITACAESPFFKKLRNEWNLTAVEYLAGQFDQRAAAAADCVRLLNPAAKIGIKSALLLAFDKTLPPADIERIKGYMINPVEMQEKDLSVLCLRPPNAAQPVPVLEGFEEMDREGIENFCRERRLAMSAADLQCAVDYFKTQGRPPTDTEIRILDTYWSDHCRHTTFHTEIEDIAFEKSFISADIRNSLMLYGCLRRALGLPIRSVTLMEIATIGARWLQRRGLLPDLEISRENNACSIFLNVSITDSKREQWLLQFKNETHNHPTEIEPFGGASTCLGGAIRDPLAGRAYVFQAMRVSGAGNIYAPIADTLEGKLPQRTLSVKAAQGFSSYGNQIGVATTHVREIYHPRYTAKRLEAGAVAGAVRSSNVIRLTPICGDIIFLIGGRTGRDGIGGAAGSSKKHTASQTAECGSEVQKGNAPEERKIQRLFRRPEAARLIKKCNDFGAGGAAVAIGELADGVDIYLDRIPVKYEGLNATELAISESQERMAVVVAAGYAKLFARMCADENLEAAKVAVVTSLGRMRMFYGGSMAADIDRSFLNSAGARRTASAIVGAVEERSPFVRSIEGDTLRDKILNNLADPNVLCQKGMAEMFDSTIGAGTVLMPFGGAAQRTETQVSVQKLPL